ncbi:MAG: hypothetical protein D6767_09610 [Candidatus Hydrogenedentota bacterium]|nr:MAG: hypothetical protein D6767_09610 [Candidatus Hydrogenedentota bacterium]
MLGKHFYFLDTDTGTTYIHHAILQEDGKFLNQNYVQYGGGTNIQVNSMTTYCGITTPPENFADRLFGITDPNGNLFLALVGGVNVCILPIDANGAIKTSASGTRINAANIDPVATTPVGIYFSKSGNLVLLLLDWDYGKLKMASAAYSGIDANGDLNSLTFDHPESSGSLLELKTFASAYVPLSTAYYRLQIYGADEELLIWESNNDLELFVLSNKKNALLSILNTSAKEKSPFVDSKGHIYFSSDKDGTFDLYRVNSPTIPEMTDILIDVYGGKF